MKRWLALAMTIITVNALAVENNPPDLPSRETLARWLNIDPSIKEAEYGRNAATHEAGMLRASPNEWIINATGQRRSYAMGGLSREWSVGVERAIRLPGKRELDTQLGERGVSVADARHIAALREALIDLTELWLKWCAAVEAMQLADDQAALAQANRVSVDKRVKAGDAARLDLNLAEADLADIERLRSEARTTAATAHARLITRFKDVPANPPELSEPVDAQSSVADQIARLIERSPALRIAEAERDQADVGVSRERADRLPDPTLAAFSAAEAFGGERLVGVSVSIPLPGRYRSQKLARALDIRDQRDATLAREKQRIEANAAALVLEARGGVERWQLARVAAQKTEENARLTQRAYALGEADLQTLLLSRRQSLESARVMLDARVVALLAQYRRGIESGELWMELGN